MNDDNNNDFPPPYSMCFEEECKERQAEHQVSIFEATFALHPITKRILHPQLAVAKYRRSAAGTTRAKRPPRSLLQLLMTWNHLRRVWTSQKSHEKMSRQSLRTTVSFVDDRIRALQVDFVLSESSCASLQIQLVKYQLVSMYLLSQVPPKEYEPKFARQALWTALTAYWNDDTTAECSNDDDDEVLCLTALCQLATCVVVQEESGAGAWQDSSSTCSFGTILLLAQHCCSSSSRGYPKFQYALEIVTACMLGMYHNVLNMLAAGCDDDEFGVLCRICMAPALSTIRLAALRHYNKAFGKLEKIASQEMARLLYLPSSTAALDFCTAAGVPVEEDAIVMKAAPVSKPKSLAWSRQEDDFVFFGNNTQDCWNDNSRVDEEGVRIPSESLLKSLIVSDDKE